MQNKSRYRLAIFASGGGSNAKCILQYFKHHKQIEIALVLSNHIGAGVIDIAQSQHIPTEIITHRLLKDQAYATALLDKYNVDFIILAGFLLLIPPYLVVDYADKIINVHPSLLPKYGGKGMYGHHVHEAVKNAGDTISGCTIHLVNEEFDEGIILKQVSCKLTPSDTPLEIATKVLKLEHDNYAKIIEKYILSL